VDGRFAEELPADARLFDTEVPDARFDAEALFLL
jgi:hypothetical protein